MDLANIVVAVVIAIITILASFIVARRQIDSISVDYEIDSDIALWQADADDVMASRIELRYEDRELRHPRFIDVTVTNTGTKPVTSKDYDLPIVFELEGNIAPVDARITAQHPSNIVDDIFEIQPNGVRAISITPRLLNPGYWFKLRMLFNHADAKLVASHRIIGGKPMREYSREQARAVIQLTKRPMIFSYLGAFFVGAFVAFKVISRDIAENPVGSPTLSLVGGSLMGGMLAATAAGVLVLVVSGAYMKFFYR